MPASEHWIDRTEALKRLGVKSQTLYAYVSRGRIVARPDPEDSRKSLYARQDIDRLTGVAPVADHKPIDIEVRAARGEALIHSAMTVVVEGRPFYRGMDAIQLSHSATMEDVARRLWGAEGANPLTNLSPRRDGVPGVTGRARLFSALSRRAEEDAPSGGRTSADLKSEAACVLNEVVDMVAGPGPRLYFHQRLGRGWRCLERDSHLIRRALVLGADHEMDPASLATRVLAGAGASPAAAALAGLSALRGFDTLKQIGRAHEYILFARKAPEKIAREVMAAVGDIPGFGPTPDPRAEALLEATDRDASLQAIIQSSRQISGHHPDFNFALAMIGRRLDLPATAPGELYMLARLSGLLGHALEQISEGSPISAKLRYVGINPGTH